MGETRGSLLIFRTKRGTISNVLLHDQVQDALNVLAALQRCVHDLL